MKNCNTLSQSSPFAKLPFGGISSSTLRILAIVFMVLDHMWATVIPGNLWMTCVGRLAFPIFAFQLVEGFFHTHDLKRYAKRLGLFAILSEVPFDLFTESTVFYPFHQNVLFTLLLGLLAIAGMERAKTIKSRPKAIALGTLSCVGMVLLGQLFFVDYGGLGVMTVIAFYLFRGFAFAWVGQLVFMTVFHWLLFNGQIFTFSVFGLELSFAQQGFAIFSLLFIWLYNGKPGLRSRAFQLGGYLFYPVHMLLLHLIVRFFL